MEHSFDINIAKKYGINSAILLKNLHFWIEKNKANKENFYDNYYWTYNSRKAFAELFPYMNERQINYAMQKLIDNELVITGNYNKVAYDRTLWYAITDKGYSILQNCQMEDIKLSNGTDKNVKPIPNIKTNIFKESKKESNYDTIINSQITNEDLKATLYEFIKMRKLIKKPMTDRALQLLIGKLHKLANTPDKAIQVLEQSIVNNWQDIYELKTNYIKPKDNGKQATKHEYTKEQYDSMFDNIYDVEI